MAWEFLKEETETIRLVNRIYVKEKGKFQD